MSIDFTKPIQTLDGDTAEKVRDIDHPTYKYLILVTDAHGKEQTVVACDEDGDTEEACGFIENVDNDDHITSDTEETPEKPVVTVLELPRNLTPRIVHSKRGGGRLVKIREAPEGRTGKTVGIILDKGKGDVLWAFDKYVSMER